MKRKMKKKLIAFMLCMVLVICNSVSILADTPAAATTTAENQVSETKTAKSEKSSEENKSKDDNDTSKQSEETDETKDKAPEATTTEKKEETTEATTEKKDETSGTTTKAKDETEKADEGTTEATTKKKDDTEAADATSESSEKKETTTTENSSETSGTAEATTESTADGTTVSEEKTETTAVTELKYEDEEVIITVSANEENAIPAGATLKVVPIRSDNTATQAQYTEVEKQLQEKAEKEDYTTLGFLAYDITFTDAQGNEVEPAGQVTVNMSYKKAVLPAEINAKSEEAADAEVTVLHLEEDANKQVQNVANLAENNQLQNIEVTDANAVKQAKFVAESFSVFTLTWGYWNQIQAQVIDTKGNSFSIDQREITVSDWDTGTINFANQSVKDKRFYNVVAKDRSKYCFVKAVVLNNNEKYPKNLGITIESLSRQQQGWSFYYTYTYKELNAAGKEYVTKYGHFNSDEQTLYFVYAKDELTEIETVDSASAGITMTLLDHDGSGTVDGEEVLNKGVDGPYNKDKHEGHVKQGMLSNSINEEVGYPTVNRTSKSLRPLFEGGQPVNKLFSKQIYDDTGYYEYSSFENYAYLDPNDGGDFTVYNQIGTPDGGNSFFYQRGNFMPYNPISPGNFSNNTNLYDENGKRLKTNDPRYNEPLYKTNNANNYYFGMYMEASFAQPKDGIVTHKDKTSDMIYEFNGDDDLWIYIDNVLVLDIGGIHDAHSGSINFATGEVIVNDGYKDGTVLPPHTTTIKDMFWNARKFPDGTSWTREDDPKVAEWFDGDTFKDYTNHDIKMFYMERGDGASNLHMKFNLQVIPKGEVLVEKELSNTDKDKYANVQFAFQVYVQEVDQIDGDNITFKDNYILFDPEGEDGEDLGYSIENKDKEAISLQNGITFENDSGGPYDNVFFLKPGEQAILKGLQANQKYYVKEIGVKSEEYSNVEVDGTTVNTNGQGPVVSVETGKEEVGDRSLVEFINHCSASNRNELQITKQMQDGQPTDETFDFKIRLENTDGELVPYAGAYYITKGNKYYKYEDDTLIELESSAPAGTTTNGEILNIPVGYTVAITQLLSGTSFDVEEINLDSSVYKQPDITVTENTAEPSDVKDEEDNIIGLGSIKLGEGLNAEVTVTNSFKTETITVTKNWTDNGTISGETNTPNHNDDVIYVGLYRYLTSSSPESAQPVSNTSYSILNYENNWKGTIEVTKDEEYSYTIEELELVDGQEGDFTIGGHTYSAVIEGESIQVNGHEYKVNVSQDENDVNKFTVTNTRLNTITINKQDNNNEPLAGATFKLEKLDDDGNPINGTEQSITTEADGTIKFDSLENGRYRITETQSPAGHSLLANPIEVTLPLVLSDGEPSDNTGTATGVVKEDGTYYYDLTYTVINNKLFTMPEAGGRNIFMITLAGTAMIALAAGSTIYYRRRRGAHNKTGR